MTGKADRKDENPYLIMGFWKFAITATLMTVFFSWSLLFCVVFYGVAETTSLICALIHDLAKTVFAILLVMALTALASMSVALMMKIIHQF